MDLARRLGEAGWLRTGDLVTSNYAEGISVSTRARNYQKWRDLA
jgi:long-subunit acyl-CoA synthetase (AMP-forming)